MNKTDTAIVWLRWLLVLPAAMAGWYLALVTGLLLHAGAEALCPPADQVSGLCIAGWFQTVEECLLVLTAALAATLVVLLPALTSPKQRHRVGLIAFIAGTMLALVIGWQAWSLWVPITTAILAGLLTLRWVWRHCC